MKSPVGGDNPEPSRSWLFLRPALNAIFILLILPLCLLTVVLVPWGTLDFSSPLLQLLGIALTFASVLLCLRIACSTCPTGYSETLSRSNSLQRLLTSIEDVPPNYESVMAAASSVQTTSWVITIHPNSSFIDPPPYHTIIIDGTSAPGSISTPVPAGSNSTNGPD